MQQRLLILVAVLLLPAVTHGDTLLSQQPDTSQFAFADHNFFDSPADTVSSFLVDDVTLASSNGQGFTIDKVTTFFRASAGDLSGVTTALLTIIQDDGVLDTEIPGTFAVPITVSALADQNQGPNFVVTASGLNLSLADGTYWVGLTPSMDSSVAETLHWTTSGQTNGRQAQWINPAGGFGIGTTWTLSLIHI